MPADHAHVPASPEDTSPADTDGLSCLVVVSPHLDDAVLSCAGLLAARPGCVVVTVYTGVPGAAAMLTDWDRRCGFDSAGQAMRARVDEDRRAIGLLKGQRVALDFLDSQYVACADAGMPALTERLMRTLAALRPDGVAIPLGLLHGDHIRVSDAGLMVREAWKGPAWFAYEDVPYRSLPGVLQERLARLHARGVVAAPAELTVDTRGKAAAVAAYASQLKGLGRRADELGREERYWRLVDG